MMGFPKFEYGECFPFDAASAPDERRLSGPSVDTPPADWTSPGVSNTPWTPGRVDGVGDTITEDTPGAGTATLDDAAGAFVAGHVGRPLQIDAATDEGNVGTFVITAVNGATQLEYANPDAVTVTESFTYFIDGADDYEGPPVDEWRDANGYDGGASTGTKVSGNGDTNTQDTPVAGTARLDDAAGAFVANMEGIGITLSGATAGGNNGLFQIVAVNGPTQLEYLNPNAVTVTEAFTYDINLADQGYGADAEPTPSWRFDVDLPDGWYTRKKRIRNAQ